MKTKSSKTNSFSLEIKVSVNLEKLEAKKAFKKHWIVPIALALFELAIKLWISHH